MMKFINAFTGSVMWVAEKRAGEYEAAGHRPAAFPDTGKPALAEKMAELTENLTSETVKPKSQQISDDTKPKKTTRKIKK